MSIQTELVVEPATSCSGKTTRRSNKGGIDGAAACPPGLKSDLPGLEDVAVAVQLYKQPLLQVITTHPKTGAASGSGPGLTFCSQLELISRLQELRAPPGPPPPLMEDQLSNISPTESCSSTFSSLRNCLSLCEPPA